MKMRFEPAHGLAGELTAPPDKSISHRAALLGAMASEPVRIERFLHAADTTATLRAVAALGALVEERAAEVVVRGTGLREAREPGSTIDVGNAGTLLRLLPGWLAAQDGRSFTLDGDQSIRRRPIDRIAAPLRQMGAELNPTDGRYAPFEVRGARLRAISHELGVASAQVKSCVLLAALAADGTTTVGEPAQSRDHTERMLLAAGVGIHRHGRHVTVQNTDELLLVALLGCFAEGETAVRGAQELRVKESDRIAGVVDGLRGLGGEIEATDDGFAVRGTGGLRGGALDARGDHRLAMMGAVAGL